MLDLGFCSGELALEVAGCGPCDLLRYPGWPCPQPPCHVT